MKNKILCPSCGSENNFYSRVCNSCKNYLRDRVVNIDLWSVLVLMIENPFKAFRNIVFAEHKNFILFLIPLIAVKFLIIIRIVSLLTIGESEVNVGLLFSFLIVLAVSVLCFIFYSFIIKILWNYFGYATRFKDNLALIIYSQLISVCAMLILFPLEVIIFGNYLFSVNPSPFQIKSVIAYIFFTVEIIVILWSFFLMYAAFYVSTESKTAAIASVFVFIILLFTGVIFSSRIIFTL